MRTSLNLSGNEIDPKKERGNAIDLKKAEKGNRLP